MFPVLYIAYKIRQSLKYFCKSWLLLLGTIMHSEWIKTQKQKCYSNLCALQRWLFFVGIMGTAFIGMYIIFKYCKTDNLPLPKMTWVS